MLLAGVALASHAAVAPKAKHIDATQCVSVSAPVTDVWCVTQRGQHGQSAPWKCPAALRLCLLRARLGSMGAQPLPRMLELATSEAVHLIAFDLSGAASHRPTAHRTSAIARTRWRL